MFPSLLSAGLVADMASPPVTVPVATSLVDVNIGRVNETSLSSG